MRNSVHFKVLVVALSSITGSCALLPEAELPLPPNEWEIFNSSAPGSSSCTEISGRYVTPALVKKFADGEWHSAGQEDYAHYHLLIGPASGRGKSQELLDLELFSESWSKNREGFEIGFSEDQVLFLRYLNNEQDGLYQWTWEAAEGDYSCKAGAIEFPLLVDLGVGDGPDGNSQRRVIMGVSLDGSLVFHETLSLAKPSILTRGLPKFWIYRFEKVGGTQ